ncbi:MAG: TonB-dependent receptor [Thermodesulfobacteriota bacterium]|nr:TonB-dependent receptor [Thermodesulfobacteriota bacterium]
MKKFAVVVIGLSLVLLMLPGAALSEQSGDDESVYHAGEVQITAEGQDRAITHAPSVTEIDLEKYETPGVPVTITDVLKDQAIIDFRGESDLVPEEDGIEMRGFDSRQFVVAIDGLAVQKTGGYWGGHFVDYSLIPMSQIETIEILPGPHSALYSGRSLGGVLNVKTKKPECHEKAEASTRMSASYGSYNTHKESVYSEGGVGRFDTSVSYEHYHTDGYLRNTDANIDTVAGRLAYVMPSDGYVSLFGTYTDKEVGKPVANDPARADYDPDYPVVESGTASGRWRDPIRQPERYKEPYSFRFGMKQPSAIGNWSAGAYYTYENQTFSFKDVDEPQAVTCYTSWGGKVQNDIQLSDAHLLTVGFDTAQLSSRHTVKIVETYAGFIQDKWAMTPRLTLKTGLRYENINIWWNNLSRFRAGMYVNPAHPYEYVKKDYDELAPKSFLTYELDDLAKFLRDTSVSVGVSRIWTPRSFCEVCSWGGGMEVDPIHGMGYDLVLARRLVKDIQLNLDISHYEIKDYVVSADSSSDYYQESPWGPNGWGRRKVALEKVHKDGVELNLNGHLMDNLDFYISAAYNEWSYEGPHNGGPEEVADDALSDRAKYRANAGIGYSPLKHTKILLDYQYQDDQKKTIVDVIDEAAGLWDIREFTMDSYHLFDLAVRQTLFEKWGACRNGVVSVYTNNLFDETYETSRGYPATDRTYGIKFNFEV